MNVRSQIALLSFFAGLALAGCNRVEPIGHYTTPKEDAIRRLTGEPAEDETAAEPTDRIVAAIIPQGEHAWIFRLRGPVTAVGKQLELFKEFVKSTNFEDPRAPKWTFPAGWTQLPASELRHATISIPPDPATPGEPPLDFSVSVLPFGGGDLDAYALNNVNRWRGQLGLTPLPPLRLSEAIEEVKGATFTALLADFSGKMKEDNMSRGPFAPASKGSPHAPAPQPPATKSP